jgi:hypothetical protein
VSALIVQETISEPRTTVKLRSRCGTCSIFLTLERASRAANVLHYSRETPLLSVLSDTRQILGSVREIADHLGMHNQPLWGGTNEIKRITGDQR